MRRRLSALLCVAALAAALPPAAAAGRQPQADSTAYDSLVIRARAAHAAAHVLQTAAALAEAGLYAEAAGILREHGMSDSGADHGVALPPVPRVQWRIAAGVDYYRLEDVDTVTMTAEELRAYRRLTETPLSLWLRATSVIRPAAALVQQLSPEVYVSEHKGRLAASALLGPAEGLLSFEPRVFAEKRFREDASGDAPFAPAASQDSDMGGVTLVAAARSPEEHDAPRFWSIPFTLHWEHYRSDRPGYESYVEYRLAPALQWELRHSGLRARISARVSYEDYYRSACDSLDVLRGELRGELAARGSRLTAQLHTAGLGEWYPRASGLEALGRIEGELHGEYRASERLAAWLRVRGLYEQQSRGPDSAAAGHTPQGSEVALSLGVDGLCGPQLRISPALRRERRRAFGAHERPLWEGRRAWEPQLRGSWQIWLLDIEALAAYRWEGIDADSRISGSDSRSLRAGGGLSVMPQRLPLVSLFVDYEYRVYAPFGANARVSENITVSASATIRR